MPRQKPVGKLATYRGSFAALIEVFREPPYAFLPTDERYVFSSVANKAKLNWLKHCCSSSFSIETRK